MATVPAMAPAAKASAKPTAPVANAAMLNVATAMAQPAPPLPVRVVRVRPPCAASSTLCVKTWTPHRAVTVSAASVRANRF
jgi:hypothetical protein